MAVNDFNRIAPFYDKISRLIFRDQLLKAQVYFLNQITSEDKVLVLGGGSGTMLAHLPECREIHYLEKSKRMIDLACKRNAVDNVDFINNDFLSYNPEIDFDFVICPFFLDCFNEPNLKKVLSKIQSLLKKGGGLLVTDFQRNGSNAILLRAMHFFFKILTNLEASQLLDIHQEVLSAGFELQKEKISHRNQLFSRLYRNL